MDIVIGGGGKVGELLCQELTQEGNDITLVEVNQRKLQRLANKMDITGVVGNCADYDIQKEADIENCDIFISVTSGDEINIIASIIAKKIGAKHTIARVRNPEYASHLDFIREGLGVTMMINPEKEAANDILRVINFPEALSVEEFANDRVSIVELNVGQSNELAGVPIHKFRQKYGNILVTAIVRDDETIIPTGLDALEPDDYIFVIGAKKDLASFYRKVGIEKNQFRSVMIIGGGRIAHYTIERLLKKKIKVKVIEKDHEKAKELSADFPKAVVIEGDGADQDFLKEERVDSFDVVISLTGVDEENIIISLFALSQNTQKIITKVSRTDLLKILGNVGLQSIITPKRLIANRIIQFVRSLTNEGSSNFERFFRVADNKAEALELRVGKESKATDIPLIDLKTKADLIIAYIVRDKELIFPGGSDVLKENDVVIVVTTNKTFDEIDDILL